MEILRFDEADAPTPKRKRPSKAWLALSMVAALMGVGTAFASSTININGNNLTPLGQGVSTATTCDSRIDVTPTAGLNTPIEDSSTALSELKPSFYLSSIVVSGINNATPDSETAVGCYGVDFKLQVWKNKSVGEEGKVMATALDCIALGDASISVDGTGSNWKCDTDAIFFRDVKESHTISVNASSDFDYITLVSTATTY
jgi:hypothetical protein